MLLLTFYLCFLTFGEKINTFNISLVVRGTVAESSYQLNVSLLYILLVCNFLQDTYVMILVMQDKPDPYGVPKSKGIFRMLESPKDITTTSVAQRIIANHDIYVVLPSSLISFASVV